MFDDTQSNERDDSSNNGGSSKKKNLLNDTDSEDENRFPRNNNDDAESVNGRELNSKNLLNYYFISNSRQVNIKSIVFFFSQNYLCKILVGMLCDRQRILREKHANIY